MIELSMRNANGTMTDFGRRMRASVSEQITRLSRAELEEAYLAKWEESYQRRLRLDELWGQLYGDDGEEA